MKVDEEFEILLEEIPRATSLNLHHHGHLQAHAVLGSAPTHTIRGVNGPRGSHPSRNRDQVCVSTALGVNVQPSEGSSWSSFYSQSPFRNTNYSKELLFDLESSDDPPTEKNVIWELREDLGRMNIRDEQEDRLMLERFLADSRGFKSCDQSLLRARYDNGENNDHKGIFPSGSWASMNLHSQQDCCLMGSNLSESYYSQSNCLFSSQQQVMENESYGTFCDSQFQANAVLGRNCYHRRNGIPIGIPSIPTYCKGSDFLGSQRHQIYSKGEGGLLNSLGSPSPPMKQAKVPNGMERSSLHHHLPVSCISQSLHSMRCVTPIEAFGCEDGIIIEGKGLDYVINMGCDHPTKHQSGIARCDEKNTEFVSHSKGIIHNIYGPLPMPLKHNSLLDVQGHIYFLAKDHRGCQFLQQKLDEGNAQDIQIIFNEIISRVSELMINPFGNYLMQKVLDVCNEEQRTKILLVLTSEPWELFNISLNMHGTRAVQKLIETVKTREQIFLVTSALNPRFVDLVKDLNGNHVIQRCLQFLTNDDNKFIFNASANFCVDIATHQHGCCVLQRCIARSSGEDRETLVAKISTNGLLLAQNAYGNYVVQYIIELKVPSATANLISQFKGNYVHLSTQKFSSNVVEKCLKEFSEENRSRIIHELLSAPKFERLLQDPFANYVIQSALRVSKGFLHDSLVNAIRSHEAVLRTSPYCKRIYARNFSKK